MIGGRCRFLLIFRVSAEGRVGVWCSTGGVRGVSGILTVCCAFIVGKVGWWMVGSVRVRSFLMVISR